MGKLYKKTVTVFLRSKALSISCCIMLAPLAALFCFCFNNYQQYGEIYSMLIWLTRPNIFIIAFFIFISYELTIKMYDNDMAEYLKAYGQGQLKAYAAIVLCLLTIVAIPSALFGAFIMFMYNYADIQYVPFLYHLIKLAVLYCGLSFIIGVMLGTAMAAKLNTKRLAVYSLTVCFILLNTTFTDVPFRMPYSLCGSYPVERMLYHCKDFFSVVPYELGSHFAIYPIYGFPMEPSKWLLAGFWIIFPAVLILSGCLRSGKSRKIVNAAGCLMLLLCFGLFANRGSVLSMDMRVDSYPYADPIYYMDRPETRYDGEEANFTIDEYKMDLTISNELHATVELAVNPPDLANYAFTLYHGYILHSVRTEAGEIPYSRAGDYISVGSLNGATKLIFEYHGKSPKFCANSQAVTLPGYFAYYPKAGKTNIWDLDRYGYVNNLSPNESDYAVNIRSNLEIFTNLAGSNGSFQGKTNGLSLFGGMYGEVAENIYAEPLRADQPQREHIRAAEEILSNILQRLDRMEFFTPLADKKIFLVPRSFSLNSNLEDIVIMSDHITCVSCINGQELAEAVMRMIIKPKSSTRDGSFQYEYLRQLFNRQDAATQPVDVKRLLDDIDEWRLLAAKHSGTNREAYLSMGESERETYEKEALRVTELDNSINEMAAQYLFSESPSREENLRLFFDYFTSGNASDYLAIAEEIMREEMR